MTRIDRCLLALVATSTLVLAACGEDDPGGSGRASGEDTFEPSATVEPSSTTTTTDASTTTTEVATATVEELEQLEVRLTEIASLDEPIAVALRPGFEELYVAERGGRVRVLNGGQVAPEPLVDISGETVAEGERGLLGLAFSPDGDRLYLSYTNLDGDSHVDELTMGAGATDVDLGSRRRVLFVAQPFSNHNGGNIVFGPDGFLYFGLGDGGSGGDPDGRAQNTEDLLGKILRIDPRAQGNEPYGIPSDNPFVAGGGRGEIWVYGVRNPWRFSFDRVTGDLWIGDVGQNAIEEIDLLSAVQAAGANLGWDRLEGTQPFEGEAPADAVPPVFEYGRDEGFSVTGGFVYRGSAIPALQGAYVFGDFGASQLRALAVAGGQVSGDVDLGLEVAENSLVSFGEDAAGELLVLSLDGPLYRLEPA